MDNGTNAFGCVGALEKKEDAITQLGGLFGKNAVQIVGRRLESRSVP